MTIRDRSLGLRPSSWPVIIVIISIFISSLASEQAKFRRTEPRFHPSTLNTSLSHPRANFTSMDIITQSKTSQTHPTYDIIDLEPQPEHKTSKGHSNMERDNKFEGERERHFYKRRLSQRLNGTLDDDIDTINALIGMLITANKKLIDRKLDVKVPTNTSSLSKPTERAKRLSLKQDRLAESSNVSISSVRSVESPEAGTSSQDLILVRPGFDKTQPHGAETTRDSISRRLDGLQRSMLHKSDQPPEDVAHNHQPIVARDLLNVGPAPQHSGAMYPRYGSHEDQMLLSRPMNPLFRSYTDRQQGVYAPEHLRGRPILMEDDNTIAGADRDDPVHPTVPPYNTLLWPPTVRPIPQRLGDHFMNGLVRPTTMQPAGGLGVEQHKQPEMEHAMERQPYPMNPLQQILMAAKDQQDAALAYDQRRLNYEAELRKRQELMKKQHEYAIKHQRQAYEKEQAQQAKDKQLRAQQQENQDQNQEEQPNEENNREGGETGGNREENNENNQPEGQGHEDNDDGMQNFGDTDFTDLFPPGILSESEIRDMKKQHREQQEEQKRQQQQEQSDGQDDQEQSQDQQDGEPAEEQGDPNGGGAGESLAVKSTHPVKNLNGTLLDNVKTVDQLRSLKNSDIVDLTNQTETTISSTKGDNQTTKRSNKTRRSHYSSLADQLPMMLLESEYHDRYIKPFLAAAAHSSKRSDGDYVVDSQSPTEETRL